MPSKAGQLLQERVMKKILHNFPAFEPGLSHCIAGVLVPLQAKCSGVVNHAVCGYDRVRVQGKVAMSVLNRRKFWNGSSASSN